MRNSIFLTLGLALTLAWTAGAKAQPTGHRPRTNAPGQSIKPVDTRVNRAVDQNVEDVDPLGTSLRRMDRGNSRFPTRSMIVKNPYAASWQQVDRSSRLRQGGLARRQYTFRGPGVKALIDRPEYITLDQSGEINLNASAKIDGAFKEVVPPNAVYSLIPDNPRSSRADRHANAAPRPIPNRLNASRLADSPADQPPHRRDGRLHLRVNQSLTHRRPHTKRASFAEIVRRRIRRNHTQAPPSQATPQTPNNN